MRSVPGLLLLAAIASAGDRADLDFIVTHNRPDTLVQPEVSSFTVHEVSEAKIAAMGLIRLYQLLISTQDMSVCNFTPSCSRFGMASIKRYGLVRGLLMTSDRLQRCNGLGIPYYHISPETGKCFDPPEQELLW